jgi:hypothetical protein
MGHYLAFDFGAESGRALLGSLSSGKLAVEEVHRFSNTPVRVLGALYWDTLRLWHEIQHGIGVAARERKLELDGIGIDTWGVDYGLLGADGALIDNPRHYHDSRTNGMMEKLFETVPRDQVFGYTGIQFMQLNTLYQWYAQKLAGSPALGATRRPLNMPDPFNYWLTGVAKSEATIASTTQFFDPCAMNWSMDLVKRLGLPGEIVPPATLLGKMLEPPYTPVYATAGHDTAAAVAAVPAKGGDNWCYVSSGTWSLMGLELDAPVINAESLALNFTNEVGAAAKIRLLKNIAGLWLLQECRRASMEKGSELSYEQLAGMSIPDELSHFAATAARGGAMATERKGDEYARTSRHKNPSGTRRMKPRRLLSKADGQGIFDDAGPDQRQSESRGKTCFFISRIGAAQSAEREFSDKLLTYILNPVLQRLGYETLRGDQISIPGTINTQVFEYLRKADLVVADLTGRNPNVFYELAVRHMVNKPFVQVIHNDEQLPFDVAAERTVRFGFDVADAARAQAEFESMVRATEEDPSSCRTLLSLAVGPRPAGH